MKMRVKTYSLFLFLLLVTMSCLHAQSGAAFYLENGSTMTLGNNIIVNNGNANFNGVPSQYNLIVNGDSVFVDKEFDFTLFFLSVAIDAGYNPFCSWLLDMNDTSRVINATVDLGAFEYVDLLHKRRYAVHQVAGGTLNLCNNVIVNNPVHTAMTNCGDLPSDNILSDSLPLFHDAQYDFSLFAASPAVDAGRDVCNNLAQDLQKHPRNCAASIDAGAFEYKVEEIQFDSVYVVFQNQEGVLMFCNNIDINNSVYARNTNIPQVQSNNIVSDNDALFMDNTDNFMPQTGSEAIDHGNDGCNTVEKDLAEKDRVMGAAIDIGAYEQFVVDTINAHLQYVVHQMNTGSLNLCNNIIVNNPAHDDVVNIDEMPDNNILSDSIPIFCDVNLNFKPYEGSPAVDSGMNSCNGLAVDIDMLPRIARVAIDVGAFELPEPDTTVAGGGWGGGGGGGGGGWGGGSGWTLYHTTVFQHSGDSLILCNNIIINNSVFIANAYTHADSVSNILTDSDTLFVDNVDNYMPRASSVAVNTGVNDCNELGIDLYEHPRIYMEIIDMGAYEQFVEEEDSVPHEWVIHQVGEGGNLRLCNNIIVNNPAHTELSNIEEIPDNNILSDSIVVFRDALYDFSLWQQSPAVNAGSNACCDLPEDIERKPRIIADIIDVGAFELMSSESHTDTTYTVLQGDTVELLLCNNIVINNCVFSLNANVAASSSHNILEDNDSIFSDNQHNYLPLPQSIAVNQGDNGCNSVEVDLAKHPRILADIIDVGAYEQFEDNDTLVIAAVHQVDTLHELRLYNNIVILNPWHTHNFGGTTVGSHNLLEDTNDVFVDMTGDFSLMENSPAIDAGDNQYVSWPWDIKHDARIACANVVDQGAFEFTLDNVSVSLTATDVTSDNCQGSYILLQATPGAQHYYWSHTNEDTNSLIVMPLVTTYYTVIASNGGECVDTAILPVTPAMALPDSLGSPSSVGKEFWLSYLHNHFRPPTLTLLLSAERSCSGTVSNPLTGWSMPFTVGAHSVSTVQIPLDQAYPENDDEVADYGIFVEATDSISVYAANYNANSFDVTNVLPVNALADEYLLQTYTPMMNAEFVIVATENNTIVEITPSKMLQGGQQANHTFTVVLQQGQTYLGKSRFNGALGDLSGTVIKSLYNKPVAVFNGNVCAQVPSNNGYTDHLVEQAVGVNYWGRSFAITSTESQNFDAVRVTALRNNTEVRKNGVLVATIQAHQTWEFQLDGTEGSCYLETSKPAGVYLYIAGAVLGNPQEMSDPSMIWIPPTEQKLNDLTFATFNSPGISNHYVNIVVPAASVNNVTFDGIPIGGQFSPLNGSAGYAFVRKQITNGTHTLHCDSGFIAHCYGLGYHESYGYAAGYKAVPLKEQLLVNGILNSDLPPDTRFCPYEPITFSVNVNYPCDSVIWNFGDSTPVASGMSYVHDYVSPGNYMVTATLYITSDGTVFCSNLYARIRIVEGSTVTYFDTICQGGTYQANGFDVSPDASGHFTYTRTITIPDQYCDSTYVLELEVRDNYLIVEDTICVNNHYAEYGFDITPTETGVYSDTLNAGTSDSGCDSLVILQLVVSPNADHPSMIEGEDYPCQGGTYTYSIDSLSGLQDVVWTVPDSVIMLPQLNPYEISLLFDTYADSMYICVSATGGCGEMSWCRTIHPHPFKFVQIADTLCINETEYHQHGFDLSGVSDTSDLFVHQDVTTNGCDSTTVLQLYFMPVYEVEDTITICYNEIPYLYHDTLLADTGLYQITLASEFGCDSTVNLTLLSYPVSQTVFDTTVCDTMLWNDVLYTESGSYDSVFVDIFGCDSIVTMHLTVNHLTDSIISVTILESELPYILNDEHYDTVGVFTQTLTNAAGCDSVVTLHLTIQHFITGTDTLTVCDSLTWIDGVTYYESTDTNIYVLTTADGCDSVVTLNLTVNHSTTETDILTVCDSLTWIDGVTYYESTDTNIYVLTAADGCDSVVTLHLTVNHSTTGADTLTACDSLTWIDGVTYYESTDTNIYVLTAANGCDSVVTLHLTVNHSTTGTDILTACDSLTWIDGVTYYESTDTNIYVLTAANGCDSVVTLHLTVIPLPELSHTPDTIIHLGDSATLWVSGADVLTWTNGNGEQLASGNTLLVSPETSTTYYIHSFNEAANLTYNGDFEAGNTGFTTDYIYGNTGSHDHYYVGHDIAEMWSWDSPGYPVTDHTSGSGLFLMIDGSIQPNTAVWMQTISVEPNTDYLFSAWFLTNNIAYFKYEINGVQTGIDYSTPETRWTWKRYSQFWNSGNDTVAELKIINRFSYSAGYDYCIDDITFTPLMECSVMDSILVTVLSQCDTDYLVTTACDSYLWYGDTLTQSGEYMHTQVNPVGCDSVEVLHLTVNHSTTGADTLTVCDSLTWIDGVTYYESTDTNIYVLTAANGCDSVVTLHLTVNHSTTVTDILTVCDSLTWIDGVTYYESTDTNIYVLTAANGCDSVVTLHLTVNHKTYGDTTVVACESYTWHGVEYTATPAEAPTYTMIGGNHNGCDSIVTLTLTVNPVAIGDTTAAACDSFSWHGNTYMQSGDYTYHTTTVNGCDSVVTLHLTIHPEPEIEISGPSALCPGSEVTLTVSGAQTYLWSTGATTPSITTTQAGYYSLTATDQFGCVGETFHRVMELGDPILSITIPDMCAGGSYYFSVGHQEGSNILLGHGETTLSLMDTIFLPDGIYCEPYGCSYHSPLTFTAYSDSDVIQSVEDIYYVRLNMEHTFIGDIYINITCPNGQKADLLKYGGYGNSPCNSQIVPASRGWANGDNMSVGTFLGDAIRTDVLSCDANNNPPGVGWNYCWSNNTTQGYLYASGDGSYIYRAQNAHSGKVDSSNVHAGTNFYHPDDPFTSLIGCPLNGDWYIEVQDGWSGDNGYIFGWELALTPEILATRTLSMDHVSSDGPWITNVSDSLFVITPPADLAHDTVITYTFTIYDTTGCSYDTTVSIYFYALPHTEMDTVVCDSLVWNNELLTESGQYEWTFPTAHCDSVFVLNLMVNTMQEAVLEDEICEGDGYHGHGLAVPSSETMGVDSITKVFHLQTVYGCDSIVTLRLTVVDTDLRIIPLTEDFCELQYAELMVETGMPDYEWSTGETSPNITVTTPGLYSVSASIGECSNTARYYVEGCHPELYLPNAITPSRGDGLNDYFSIPEVNQANMVMFEIAIYNRWGELVFYSKDKNFKWNGEYRGQIYYETIYNYVIRYTDTAGKPYVRTGSITIL